MAVKTKHKGLTEVSASCSLRSEDYIKAVPDGGRQRDGIILEVKDSLGMGIRTGTVMLTRADAIAFSKVLIEMAEYVDCCENDD